MIKNYKYFKNFILEEVDHESDNPFSVIDKSIKNISSNILNMLTLDNEIKEVNGIYYMITKNEEGNKIIKKLIITKIDKGRVFFKILNDSNIGKYKKEDEKEQVLGLSKLYIYKNLEKLSDILKKSGDDLKVDNKVKNKLNQTKYIENIKNIEQKPVDTTTSAQVSYNYKEK